MQGIDEIIPVDVYVPGCPPSPEALIAAIMKVQEKITKGEQAKAPQGAHRLGAPGDGAIDRRERRAAWAKDDAERARRGAAAAGRARAAGDPGADEAEGRPPWLAPRPTPAGATALRDHEPRRPHPPAGARRRGRSPSATGAATSRSRSRREAWVRAATLLRDHAELDFKLFLDLCGVDYLDREDHPERFAVVLHALLRHPQAPRPAEDLPARGRARPSTPWWGSTRAPTGSSARPGTSTASSSRATRTSSASSPTTRSWGTRCGRTTRPRSGTC